MRIIEVDAIVKVPFPHADAFKRDKAWDEIIKKCYACQYITANPYGDDDFSVPDHLKR